MGAEGRGFKSLYPDLNLNFQRSNKVIFDNLSLSIINEKITAIMGPSGCGKTTLLKLIGGQLKPNSGIIKVKGKDVNTLNKKELCDLRKDVGMLFQTGALFSDLNVYENVAFPIREHTNLTETLIKDLVSMKLHSVGLKGTEMLMPSQLSVGMAKRIALARTIALDPSIIMYDEPFSGQDPISMATLIKLIIMLNKSLRITTVIVSHDVYETMDIADYVYILNEKKIICEGKPDDIRNVDNNFVKYFINKKINYNDIIEDLDISYEKNFFYNK
ncbi:MAG TPA: ABC transporter ATP-binding protein [Candidatus Azoamicus sp.]